MKGFFFDDSGQISRKSALGTSVALSATMKQSDITIATPCGQDWQSMSPREKSRFCGECKKVVHDLTSMKEKEAKKLLATPATEGLCVRYMYDEQGNVWFQDSMFMRTEGLLKKVAAVAAIAAAPFLTACMGAAVGNDGPFESAQVTESDQGSLGNQGNTAQADAGPSTDTDAGPMDPSAQDRGTDAATDPNADPDAGTDPNVDPDAGTDPNADPDAGVDPNADPDAAAPNVGDAGLPRHCRDKRGRLLGHCDPDAGPHHGGHGRHDKF